MQGSGFVYNFNGKMVVITNYHVVQDTINNTVTFSNGDAYTATVLGSDPYADLAVVSTDAPENEYSPLEIVDSSTLSVGDPLIAVGSEGASSLTFFRCTSCGRTRHQKE